MSLTTSAMTATPRPITCGNGRQDTRPARVGRSKLGDCPMNAPAAISVQHTGATLGAIVTGINLATLTDAEWPRIEAAFNEYAVLIFPGQHLSAEAQTA